MNERRSYHLYSINFITLTSSLNLLCVQKYILTSFPFIYLCRCLILSLRELSPEPNRSTTQLAMNGNEHRKCDELSFPLDGGEKDFLSTFYTKNVLARVFLRCCTCARHRARFIKLTINTQREYRTCRV
jgi:hypothetical protein